MKVFAYPLFELAEPACDICFLPSVEAWTKDHQHGAAAVTPCADRVKGLLSGDEHAVGRMLGVDAKGHGEMASWLHHSVVVLRAGYRNIGCDKNIMRIDLAIRRVHAPARPGLDGLNARVLKDAHARCGRQ